MVYLLNDLLLIKSSLTEKLGKLDLSSDKENNPGNYVNTFTSTGFSYSPNERKWSVGLNLNELTSIDALRDLELTIYGNEDEKLSKIDANMNIKVSLATISINAKFTLEDTPTSQSDWSSSIQSAFDTINNVSFSSTYLDKPTKYLTK